jgi:hypothetical protein
MKVAGIHYSLFTGKRYVTIQGLAQICRYRTRLQSCYITVIPGVLTRGSRKFSDFREERSVTVHGCHGRKL